VLLEKKKDKLFIVCSLNEVCAGTVKIESKDYYTKPIKCDILYYISIHSFIYSFIH